MIQSDTAKVARGLGTMVSMQVASRLSKHYDQRKIMAAGLLLLGWTFHSMSLWTPDVSQHTMLLTLLLQGCALGLIFNPMTVMAFATLPVNLRGDATALQALSRNLGAAIGISVLSFMLTRNTQISHADIAAYVTPFNRMLQDQVVAQYWNPATGLGAQVLDQVTALGVVRDALPTHYWFSWTGLLQTPPDTSTVSVGLLTAIPWTVVPLLLAFWNFRRKDILS